jgi:hypothetical protein
MGCKSLRPWRMAEFSAGSHLGARILANLQKDVGGGVRTRMTYVAVTCTRRHPKPGIRLWSGIRLSQLTI